MIYGNLSHYGVNGAGSPRLASNQVVGGSNPSGRARFQSLIKQLLTFR